MHVHIIGNILPVVPMYIRSKPDSEINGTAKMKHRIYMLVRRTTFSSCSIHCKIYF